MGDRRSNQDDVLNISTSFFVTNFPEQTTAKELWRLCKEYGNVIDVFIPNRRSKLGKRFGFVRFIKILDVVRLVNILCTIWIGKIKLHVNIAIFNMPLLDKGSHSFNPSVNGKPTSDASYKKVESRPSSSYIQADKVGISSLSDAKALKPALVLDDSCAHKPDLASLVGGGGGLWVILQFSSKISKDNFMLHVRVNSWFSMIQQASNSFSVDERVVWIDVEGIPLCAWFHNTFTRIASICGTLLYVEDENSPYFHMKRLCIKTSFQDIIFASQKIIAKGKVFLIRVKELTGWAPSFNDDSDSDDESVDSHEASILKDEFSDKNNDMEEISETVFDKSEHVGNISPACNEVRMETRVKEKSEDPFNIYDMLNKKKPTKSVEHSDSDIQYPLGFTPCDRPQVNSNLDHINETKVLDKEPGAKASFQEDVNVSGCSGHFQSVKAPKSGGSILRIIEDFINVGQTMGYKMEGCIKDFEEIVSSQGETKMETVDLFNIKACWGNINFDYVVSPSVGNSAVWWKYLLVVSPLHGRIDKRDSASNLKKDLKNKLSNIDSLIDKGKVSSAILEDRLDTMNKLASLENMESSELAQKAKVKWSIEALDLERHFSKEEIKGSVWDCGLDKSPGRDGFTFGFYRRYWSLLEDEVVEAVNHFYNNGFCHKGGNSSFIALIPKTQGAMLVKDFRPISLIGSLYKIITKLLANRLVTVIGNLVNDDQSAFIANREILDGPFILNELIHWGKAKKKETMIFKVDFEKDFDSVCWDFLEDVLKNFGFGSRWCDWIVSCLKSSKGSVLVNGSPTSKFQFILCRLRDLNRKMMLVKWNNVLASKEMGGLGVSSFYALNRALIFKWVWRFCMQGNSIWTKVIKALHSEEGNLDWPTTAKFPSNWLDIIRSFSNLYYKGVDLLGSIKRKVGNGENTMFWDELWKGEVLFKNLFPRLYALGLVKNISVADKMAQPSLKYSFRRNIRGGAEQVQMASFLPLLEGLILPNMIDRYMWSISGDGEFSISSVRNYIDDKSLGMVSSKTQWCKFVPIKCLAAGGNTFLEFRDNIQGYVSAAAGNYNQGNPGYRLQGVANQMRPPGEMDEPMENPRFDEEEEWNEFMDDDQDEEVEEWLMALVTPTRATVTVPSTYEVGGPSTATPIGHPFTTMASGVAMQPQVIDDLCVRMSNLKYRHKEMVKKIEIVSDTEVADSIAIGEIHPRVTNLEGQVQTLQTSLHGAWFLNQQLQTRLSVMENRKGTLISYMSWMEERLVVLEKRFMRPPTGP
uniref:RNA-directed DNA polymerase, eukaryota, reverse transcriptase zinc-binding domain protein n=1 Tax=Tanacetum cinerariifolium TaxID=118510 RepID=A0A6L2NNT0_TANCI|nr:RNA-directed DNA polymerase, eukaryota, reverse transcriptase zinc-binding domain protein [Tanacetum cinerariifolium]